MKYTDLLPYAQAWQQQHGGKRYDEIVALQPLAERRQRGRLLR